jgi:soluble lytic murein transglycosylase-like protein
VPTVGAIAATGAFGDSPEVAVAGAEAVPALHMTLLQQPVDRFRQVVEVAARRIHAAERVAARKRKREEAFATLPGGVSLSTLEAIAACESGGDPTAVSAGGTYRGKYQFDQGTWESVGGHGDPAAAPEREQDYRAALLYERSGSSPWPVCG